MKTHLSRLSFTLPLVAGLVGLTGCGANFKAEPMAPMQVAGAQAPAVLDRSLFSKDSAGSMSENDLQHVLSTPIDLQLPARVGVVPLAQPFDPRDGASITIRATAAKELSSALVGHPFFSHVSDISTDLPNTGGIEGLRLIAARYRLRYLLLYSERFEDGTHMNGWAALYPTIIGMFVAPGVTVESRGLAQADLLDVRTGTVLFSVVQPMKVKSSELMIGAARSHQELQAEAAAEAAKKLAKKVGDQTSALVAFADEMGGPEGAKRAKTRIIPAPVVATQ
ncbi:MAG: hypothetical protein U0359_04615 [Byssovorax sp.]